jgi:hypothetical protein
MKKSRAGVTGRSGEAYPSEECAEGSFLLEVSFKTVPDPFKTV